MNINMYVINAILILMVIRQIREHPLDLRSLAVPVLAVGCAAVLFLHSVPGGGDDTVLELSCVLTGAVMGTVGGLATRLRLGLTAGRSVARAGWQPACGSVVSARGWPSPWRRATAPAGDRPVQHRAPHHRFSGVGGGTDHDGAGRRAHPAGNHLPAWPAAGRPGGRRGPYRAGIRA